MSFNWKEYINLAEEFVKFSNDEARLRTALSRAYYGAFCLARNKKGFKSYKKSNVHQKVIMSFKSSYDNDEQLIGKYLDDLRKGRNDADYDEDKRIDQKLVKRAVAKAKKILEKL